MALKSLFSPNGLSVGNLFSSTNIVWANGDITAGNAVSANYFIGNGAFLTGISGGSGSYSNANVANYLASNANVTILTQGNVTANYLLGNATFADGVSNTYFGNVTPASPAQGDVWIDSDTGIQLIYFVDANGGQWAEMTAVNSFNFGSDYGNADVALYLPTYIGSLPSLAGNVTTAANVQGVYILGNITQATGYYVYGNANVANYLPTYTGNLTANVTSLGVTQVNGNLVVAGNISATGNLSYFNVVDLVVNDPLIYLASNNTGDTEDIGIVGNYNDGLYAHTGIARDYTDDTWKFFSNVTSEPNTVIAWNEATYANVKAGNMDATVNGYSIGYLNIPQVSLSANATLALSDSGKHYYSTTSSTLSLTIPSNSSVAFSVGSAVNIVNTGTANIVVAPASGVTLYLAGNTTATGNRTVTQNGLAQVLKLAANTWIINGTGVS